MPHIFETMTDGRFPHLETASIVYDFERENVLFDVRKYIHVGSSRMANRIVQRLLENQNNAPLEFQRNANGVQFFRRVKFMRSVPKHTFSELAQMRDEIGERIFAWIDEPQSVPH